MVFRGTSSGADSSVANLLWLESSGVANAHMGVTLAPAGDTNGDGRPDLLVGEMNRVDLAQSAGSTLLIEQTLPYTNADWRIATAGDVNGDGFSDVLVGDFTYSNGQASEGRVLVHYGAGSPPSPSINWSTSGPMANDNLGWSVASAGDVNGDGIDDILVGGPTWSAAGQSNNGLVMLFYGHASGPSTSADWSFSGVSGDQVGISVAAGDLNGDGYSDLIVGSHTAAGGRGQVRIWYGSSSGPSVSGPSLVLTGAATDVYFGASVACAGDVDGDGYPDVVIGAPNGVDPVTPRTAEGRAYLYRGGAAGLASSPVWSRSGGQANAHLGTSVAAGGDVNGDSYGDVLIGTPDWDGTDPFGNPIADQGRICVEFGGSSGIASEQVNSPVDAWRWGASVADAGDVNGDGYSDVLAGGPNAQNTQPGEGVARVLAGGPNGLSGIVWTQYGGEAYGNFGSSVAGAGDVDGDGLSDVLVGAVFQDAGGPQDQGRAYIYRGPLTAGTPAFWSAGGGSSFANMGHSLANAGDVNGDGWPDMVFGEPGYTGGLSRQGFAQVRLGARGAAVFQLGLGWHTASPVHFIQPGCLTDPGSLVLFSTGRSSAGRARVRMQYRVTPVVGLSAPSASGFSGWAATNTPGPNGSLALLAAGSGPLVGGVPYAWQMRTLSRNVWYPTGPWRMPPRSGRREVDARVPGSWLAVPHEEPPVVSGLVSLAPNPMLASASVTFALAHSGVVTLQVLDVQGRCIRTLEHRFLTAGPHQVAWDGWTQSGTPAGAGIYLVRLEADGRATSRKLVRVR
jgi:hypothetical protein